jgi:hypothetical protein
MKRSVEETKDTTYVMKRAVIEMLFEDKTWRYDKLGKTGGYDAHVASLFTEDYLETLFEENDPHLQCSKKELADLLKEYVILGMGAYDSIEEIEERSRC